MILGREDPTIYRGESVHFNTEQSECSACFLPLCADGSASGLANAKVRLADSDHQRSEARLLINRKYECRGYGAEHDIPVTPFHLTFTASDCCRTMGTVTLAVDSAGGIAADALFRQEINEFRALPNAKVCELTKLAFDAHTPSKPVLAALFHIVFIYGYRQHRCTDLFIEVNPRHRRFYESMLGFSCVGTVKHHAVVNAPAQLMWLSVNEIRKRVDFGQDLAQKESARSLYRYFFSPEDEDGVFDRLVSQKEYLFH
jgi:hypothetical protein